jgi:hypothetical protein
MPHELPFGAYLFEKHHELQLEEDHWVNGGTTSTGIGFLYELAHKREIKRSLEMAIKVSVRHQVF